MKVHQFVRMIREAGGEEVHIRGGSDHRRFRLPSGELLDVPVGGRHSGHVKPYLLKKLERLMYARRSA